MFDPLSGRNIWVAPTPSDREDGTREAPFSSIRTAIGKAQPGSIVVLTEGEYEESVTIQERSGEEMSPITIMADPSAEAVILKREWYFYQLSDFIIKGLTFLDTPNTALSLVGNSQRNIFKEMLFINCGESAECTLFLGGSGGEFNVIENCQFTRTGTGLNRAILIAQSQDLEDPTVKFSTNTVVRCCTFENYTSGILLGSSDDISEAGNHQILENLFNSCGEGVRIKAIASEVRDNIFHQCEIGVIQVAGEECEINNNRFDLCKKALVLATPDTTIIDNCCINSPVSVTAFNEIVLPTVITGNSFIFTDSTVAVTVEGESSELSVIVSDNLLFNGTIAEHSAARFHENKIFGEGELNFLDAKTGDFRTTETVGCKTTASHRTKIAPIPSADMSIHGVNNEDDDSIPTMDERDLYLKSLFVINEDDIEENPEDYRSEDDGVDDGEFYDYED